MNNNSPKLIELPIYGRPEIGYLSTAEEFKNVPFEIKRIYWTYYTPNHIVRGHHAHKELNQILIAISGIINVKLETLNGVISSYELNTPSKGLFIPAMYWRTIEFSHNAVLLCLASDYYSEEDYIRKYNEFKKWKP